MPVEKLKKKIEFGLQQNIFVNDWEICVGVWRWDISRTGWESRLMNEKKNNKMAFETTKM